MSSVNRTTVLLTAAAAGDLLLVGGQVMHRSHTEGADHIPAIERESQIVHRLLTEGRLRWQPDGAIHPPTEPARRSA